MNLITVITPTYNRSKELICLYDSLKAQAVNNFEWLIVDDGSTDNTESVVDSFIKESLLLIHYIKKKNGGKHTALNKGIHSINTPLTMIVDSDDKLLPNATAEIENIHKKYKDKDNISGYTFLRCYSNGHPIVNLPEDESVHNYIDFRIKGNRPGDMAEVFKTDILKKNPFPEFENERFISEDVVWIEIGKKYDCVYINKAIYECEYLPGGLTANDKPMKFASPRGSMLRGKQLMSKECGLRANLKGAIIYNCYLRECSKQKGANVKSIRDKVLILLTKPLGCYFHRKWKGGL